MVATEPQWEYYPDLVEDAPALFLVDLSMVEPAPLADKPELVRCSIAIARAAESDGVGDDEEASELFALEEALTKAAEARGGTFVGHVRHGGQWSVAIYGPTGIGKVLEAAVKQFVEPTGRACELDADEDSDWGFFFEYLLPDPERFQWIQDRDTVAALKEEGDLLDVERPVDHFLRFADDASRDAFLRAAVEAGFRVGEGAQAHAAEDPDDELPVVAHVIGDTTVELDTIHDVVMELCELAEPHRGEYESWETEVTEK